MRPNPLHWAEPVPHWPCPSWSHPSPGSWAPTVTATPFPRSGPWRPAMLPGPGLPDTGCFHRVPAGPVRRAADPGARPLEQESMCGQSSPAGRSAEARGPPIRRRGLPQVLALADSLFVHTWAQLVGPGRSPGPHTRSSGGTPRPSKLQVAAPPGGSGGWEGWEGRELIPPPGTLHPLRRKFGHTHCRNLGAGLGSQETGPEVPEHKL